MGGPDCGISLSCLSEKHFDEQALPDNLIIPPQPDEGFLLRVSYTRLADQSVVLSIAVHHSLVDADSIFNFFRAWAAHSTGGDYKEPGRVRHLLMGKLY